MFVRLVTCEEDRSVSVKDATAVEVPPRDVSTLIKAEDNGQIPEHLKRVKKEGDRILMLKCQGIRKIPNGIAVKIPEARPITQTQFEIARKIWPCHFYNQFEEAINQAQCKKRMLEALEFYRSIFNYKLHCKDQKSIGGSVANHFCSGVCLIFNEVNLLHKSFDHEYILGHSVSDCVSEVSKLKGGYLCTGYSAFLYQEPCTSCAMALVHGRIKAVFCYKRGSGECPFSKLKFNYNRSLNHRFNVYFYED